MIIKIPKKGSLSDCNNWRGITLLSLPSKIFCKVIILRITKAVHDILQTNKLNFARGADVRIKFSRYGIYLSNVLSGIGSCMLISPTKRKRLTVFTGIVFGRF